MDKSLLDAYSKLGMSYHNIDIDAKSFFNGIHRVEKFNSRNFIKEHFN